MKVSYNPICPICDKEIIEEIEVNNMFCPSCREEALKRPISKGVLTFIFIVIAISLAMLVKFPDSLKASILYEKGLDLTLKNHHVTALKHLNEAVNLYPHSKNILVAYYEAQVNNLMLAEAQETRDKITAIGGEPSGSAKERFNTMTKKFDLYYLTSQVTEDYLLANADTEISKKIEVLSALYDENQPLMDAYRLSELYYAQKDYPSVIRLLEPIIKKHDDWLIGYDYLIRSLFKVKKFDEAQAYSLQYIDQQVDNTFGYKLAAMVEIARRDFKAALAFAQKAPYSDQDKSLNTILAFLYNKTGDAKKGKIFFEVLRKTGADDQKTIDFLNAHMKPAL